MHEYFDIWYIYLVPGVTGTLVTALTIGDCLHDNFIHVVSHAFLHKEKKVI